MKRWKIKHYKDGRLCTCYINIDNKQEAVKLFKECIGGKIESIEEA